MTSLPVCTMTKRNVYLTATLSAYTLALLYICKSLDYDRNKRQVYVQQANTSGPPRPLAFNSLRLPVHDAPIWKLSALPPIQNSFKTNSHERLTMKLRVKHTPRKNNSHIQENKELPEKVSYFREKLNETEFKLMRQTMEVFDFVMTQNKLDYMLYGGTLIGSYRHHGLVPWDDDMDVLVPLSTKSYLPAALKDLSKEYTLYNDEGFTWKLFPNEGYPFREFNWSWPFLDIFFYAENETHIWDSAPQFANTFVYLKSDIFPLRRRPFLNLQLLAPFNPLSVININYDILLCKSGKWIHKWERSGEEKSVPCSLLYVKFPFVKRTLEDSGCNETLIQNGKIISHFVSAGMSC